jgi:ribosomal protein S18 acetylase RimI-like enzyme
MELREYTPADEAQVVALWTSVFGYPQARNDPEQVLATKLAWDSLVLVAAEGSTVLGTLMVGYDGHRGWFYRLAVLESARRRGVARALVGDGERRLQALGCKKLNLQVHTHNDAAARFWAALGYELEPRLDFGKDLGGASR